MSIYLDDIIHIRCVYVAYNLHIFYVKGGVYTVYLAILSPFLVDKSIYDL